MRESAFSGGLGSAQLLLLSVIISTQAAVNSYWSLTSADDRAASPATPPDTMAGNE